MIKKLLLLVALLISTIGAQTASADVKVNGYFRKDGTYVAPHMRSNPDGNFQNNWSTKGNVNPYTGQPGTKVYPTTTPYIPKPTPYVPTITPYVPNSNPIPYYPAQYPNMTPITTPFVPNTYMPAPTVTYPYPSSCKPVTIPARKIPAKVIPKAVIPAKNIGGIYYPEVVLPEVVIPETTIPAYTYYQCS